MNNKGFTMGDIVPIALVIVVAGIALALGGTVLEGFRSTQTTNGYAYNSSTSALQGVQTIGNYIPTIALVAVVAIVIGILTVYLMRKM